LGFEKREGARVTKGERIARVDDKQLKNEVERYTAEVAEAQKQAVQSTGCDVLQGYLIGKPMPAAEFRALLLAQ